MLESSEATHLIIIGRTFNVNFNGHIMKILKIIEREKLLDQNWYSENYGWHLAWTIIAYKLFYQ